MASLVYFMICSLDGYFEDESGRFDWSQPDREVHEFVNDLVRPVGTYLYGRRMYEVMNYWEQPEAFDGQPPYIQDFARIWRAAEKVVFSTRLETASGEKTRIERNFDPQAIRRLKETARSDLAIGGADLAGQAIRAGLVDEYQLLLSPIIVGGGKRVLPDAFRTELELVAERRFRGGSVFLHYRARRHERS
jgi:dihydrofolate reductase